VLEDSSLQQGKSLFAAAHVGAAAEIARLALPAAAGLAIRGHDRVAAHGVETARVAVEAQPDALDARKLGERVHDRGAAVEVRLAAGEVDGRGVVADRDAPKARLWRKRGEEPAGTLVGRRAHTQVEDRLPRRRHRVAPRALDRRQHRRDLPRRPLRAEPRSQVDRDRVVVAAAARAERRERRDEKSRTPHLARSYAVRAASVP
jgi:hypothetical protein